MPARPARRACQHAVGDCSVGYLASGWNRHQPTAACSKIEPHLALPFVSEKVAAMLEPSLRILSSDSE